MIARNLLHLIHLQLQAHLLLEYYCILNLIMTDDNNKIIEIIQLKGYDVTYNKAENFFKISYPNFDNARFQMNLILKSGMVDIVWCV